MLDYNLESTWAPGRGMIKYHTVGPGIPDGPLGPAGPMSPYQTARKVTAFGETE